jgi:hypothetical protein
MTDNTPSSYEEVCKSAATDQGLDPITAHLRKLGIPVVVEQTGGFCMVATVYLNDGHTEYIGITPGEYNDEKKYRPGTWLVCFYPDREDIDPPVLDWHADSDRVVALIRAHTNSTEVRLTTVTRVSEETLNPGRLRIDRKGWFHEKAQIFGSLRDSRAVPEWLTRVSLYQYTPEQIDDLILLACTYPDKSQTSER